ncbi:hypothetical protein WR25_09697 [Diploscapter pachys]|uniref:Uncharacterized protein n=1 Tax=Diploscapter pachys TaxID=2018661 RepID=A0A2A2K2X7_9BILA|nr:hypothetical protein WR25_09697 [Diploscapter pachys]
MVDRCRVSRVFRDAPRRTSVRMRASAPMVCTRYSTVSASPEERTHRGGGCPPTFRSRQQCASRRNVCWRRGVKGLVGDLCAARDLAAGRSGSVPNNCIALLLRYDREINRVGTANRPTLFRSDRLSLQPNSKTDPEHQRVQGDVHPLATQCRIVEPGGGVDIDIFDVEVQEDPAGDVHVDARLRRPAYTVIEVYPGRPHRPLQPVRRRFVPEDRIVYTRTDIGADMLRRHEMILGGQGRWQDPGGGELADAAGRAPHPADRMFRGRGDQFDADMVGSHIGRIDLRHHAVVDLHRLAGEGGQDTARPLVRRDQDGAGAEQYVSSAYPDPRIVPCGILRPCRRTDTRRSEREQDGGGSDNGHPLSPVSVQKVRIGAPLPRRLDYRQAPV